MNLPNQTHFVVSTAGYGLESQLFQTGPAALQHAVTLVEMAAYRDEPVEVMQLDIEAGRIMLHTVTTINKEG